MFRLQNNTPGIYVENSRDFQLLCRLFDYMINGIKYDIDSILNILNPMKINDRMLNLLCTKLGFFPKNQYDSRTLRYILSTFPLIVKNKSSKKGIELAVNTILKLENNDETPSIEINNEEHVINIYTTINDIENKKALSDILDYVLPIGYTLNIEKVYRPDLDEKPTVLIYNDSYEKLIEKTLNISGVFDPDKYKISTNNLDKKYSTRYEVSLITDPSELEYDKG